jgi:hypothetical protein
MQFTGLKHLHAAMPTAVKLDDEEEVTEEVLLASLRRSLDWMSSLQADDGHWPGDFSGILYLMPFWVRDPTSPCIFGQHSPTYRTLRRMRGQVAYLFCHFHYADFRATHH